MSESTTAATGEHTTDGVPHGRTSLTPHLVVRGAQEAIAFYRDVLGARVHDVTRFGDAVAHAELELADGWFTLSDALDAYGLTAPAEGEPVTYSLAVYVPDVDAVAARAVEHGATLREGPETYVSGDRFASLLDPFGVRWSVMTRVVDLSPQESARRVAEWAAAQG